MHMENRKTQSDEKKSSFKVKFRHYFGEYTENTSIHGLKYLGEKNRTIIEKIWWAIALIVALYFCIVLVISTYRKWENSPVIVSFATKETPIWQIPFPAVTICPETKSLPNVFNYTYFLNKMLRSISLSPEEEMHFSYVAALCTYQRDLKYQLNSNVIENDEILNFFEKVSPKLLEHIFDCSFMGHPYNCSEIFTPIITDEGICYSFNLLNREDILSDRVEHFKNYHSLKKVNKTEWSLQHGYENTAGKNTYPKRALYAGAIFGFELKIRTLDEELDFTCGNSIQGYKLQIHHPAMLPRVKQQHFRLPLNQALIAAIMPTIMETSDAVMSYKPKRRQCFFPSERNLTYFKIYTQQNCQIECKTNYTLHRCGCVDFYMPRENGTKTCGAPLKACMLKAEGNLIIQGIDTNIRFHQGLSLENDAGHRIIQECNCMPECTSMLYIIENSQSEWDWVRKYQFQNFSKENKTHMSYLQVFFKNNQFITSERNELYGPTDFLANFGGLLGLFTGFSMLSLIEILYYLTLRLVCNIKLFGTGYWSGRSD